MLIGNYMKRIYIYVCMYTYRDPPKRCAVPADPFLWISGPLSTFTCGHVELSRCSNNL